MGKYWDHISPQAKQVIGKQHVFFIATAPLNAKGRVNVSPKGHPTETFRVLDDHQVAFLDLTGSGIETVAHVKENGRITFMFCNFDDGPPCIIRLWGRAVVHERGTPEFDSWLSRAFPLLLVAAATEQQGHPGLAAGVRSVIIANIYEVGSACGYAVPIMEYKQDRDTLLSWAANKGANELVEYKQKKNVQSLDGLTGLEALAFDSNSHSTSAGSKHRIASTGAGWLQRHYAEMVAATKPDALLWFAAGVAVGTALAGLLSKQH